MNQNKKIILLAHCILNINSKVEGIETESKILRKMINFLLENEIGIIQVPCPEMTHYGMARWGHVKSQFNNPFYRKHCKSLITPIVEQVIDYKNNGYCVIGFVGIDGSPSCGVNLTCSANWKGEISEILKYKNELDELKMISESGVFIEEIKKSFSEANINLPFYAIDELEPNKSYLGFVDFVKEGDLI